MQAPGAETDTVLEQAVADSPVQDAVQPGANVDQGKELCSYMWGASCANSLSA